MKPDLMQAFGFDEVDLEANRSGTVSPGQRLRLDGLYQARRSWWWQTILLILAVQAVGWLIALVTGNIVWQDLPYVLLLLMPLSLIVMLNSLYSSRIQRRLQNGEVWTAEGAARLKTGYSRGYFYTLWLGRKTFQLMSAAEYEALQAGAQYRLYYVASVPTVILSLEEL